MEYNTVFLVLGLVCLWYLFTRSSEGFIFWRKPENALQENVFGITTETFKDEETYHPRLKTFFS